MSSAPIKPRDEKKLFNIAKTLIFHLALAILKSAQPSLRKVNLEFGSTVSRQVDEKFACLVVKCISDIIFREMKSENMRN